MQVGHAQQLHRPGQVLLEQLEHTSHAGLSTGHQAVQVGTTDEHAVRTQAHGRGDVRAGHVPAAHVCEPSPAAARYLDLCAGATAHVIDLLKPGMTSHDADGLARGFFDDHGCGDLFSHRPAYSIGIAFPPLWWENDIMQMRPNDQRVLEPGMTFHLVPGLHVSDVGFVNQSAPVVITETGCEPLIDLPLSPEPL